MVILQSMAYLLRYSGEAIVPTIFIAGNIICLWIGFLMWKNISHRRIIKGLSMLALLLIIDLSYFHLY